jgi:hypothetical protein
MCAAVIAFVDLASFHFPSCESTVPDHSHPGDYHKSGFFYKLVWAMRPLILPFPL